MMSIFVSSLADLTAGIAFQPVINRFAGVHKPALDDNTVVNVAVGIAYLLQVGHNAFFSRLTAVDAHIPAVMKRCRVSAYERYAEGRLQRNIYLMERDKLNAESDSLSSEKERLEKELLALSQSRNRELTETCDMARKTLTADELTNEMLLFFIDRVNVYSGMRVEIIYRFSDEIARLIEQENTAE